MTTEPGGCLPAAAQLRTPAATHHGAPTEPAASDAPELAPLDVMLATMRWAHAEAERLHRELGGRSDKDGIDTTKLIASLRTLALAAAKDAAPYVHMRLASFTPSDDKPGTHESWLDLLERRAAEAAARMNESRAP